MIEVTSEQLENHFTHFKIIIYNTPAGLSKNEEDVLKYLVEDLNITPDESITVAQIISQEFPNYSLSDGQEKLSYEFVFKKKVFTEEDFYYLEDDEFNEEQDFYYLEDDEFNGEQEPVEKEEVPIQEDEDIDQKTKEAYDDLWEDYMNFLEFGKYPKFKIKRN